jgi:hypothetical protein
MHLLARHAMPGMAVKALNKLRARQNLSLLLPRAQCSSRWGGGGGGVTLCGGGH